METNNTHGFEIQDLYLATALLSAGCKLKEVKEVYPQYFSFIFQTSPTKCQKVIVDFRSGKLEAPVKNVIDNFTLLKHLMSKRRSNN